MGHIVHAIRVIATGDCQFRKLVLREENGKFVTQDEIMGDAFNLPKEDIFSWGNDGITRNDAYLEAYADFEKRGKEWASR